MQSYLQSVTQIRVGIVAKATASDYETQGLLPAEALFDTNLMTTWRPLAKLGQGGVGGFSYLFNNTLSGQLLNFIIKDGWAGNI
ncbi:hypothetical protein [Hymenobacter sp. YC55]|uniref:hypothetical protein n=1 Tax=Hymenobacter sp. YC55 TaxID=3034019 RepID=UPI0023F9A6E9|nr:hypothetical protein [Hymenobacter sp. YC55]MDF7814107.1 hypothetical protein [Hymenobacter sp. YC55]